MYTSAISTSSRSESRDVHVPTAPCYIAKVPLNVLWFSVVSMFLEVRDIASMERAFTNKIFYSFKNEDGERQGVFYLFNNHLIY